MAGETDEQVQRGKLIYQTGKGSSDQPVMALMGREDVEVPAGVLPCINCHGVDGRGKPEGGVTPSDITWDALTRPYGNRTAAGRQTQPYDQDTLEAAIGRGLDASGNQLDGTMPRYRMSPRDMADLIAYIKVLGSEASPGVTENAVTVGVLLPPESSRTPYPAREVLDAWFADLEKNGGIYGRGLSAIYVTPGARNHDRLEAARRMMEGNRVFALLAPYAAGIEKELALLSDQFGVPVIGPYTQTPHMGFPPERGVFYLIPGLADQARALFLFAADRWTEKPDVAVIHAGNDPNMIDVAKALEDLNALGNHAHLAIYTPDGVSGGITALARVLHTRRVENIFYLGLGSPKSDRAFLAEAARLDWKPDLYLPGITAGPTFLPPPAELADRVYLAFSTAPGNLTREGARRYARLSARRSMPARPSASYLAVLAAASLFEHGLQIAGRDVNRTAFIDGLEGLYAWHTGFMPPVTYNPNRRAGSRGAYVVTIDPALGKLKPVSEWIDVENHELRGR